jgi:hypothetical protein
MEMAISSHVNFDDETWEEYMHAKTMHANVPTSKLALVCAETVERIAKVWYM